MSGQCRDCLCFFFCYFPFFVPFSTTTDRPTTHSTSPVTRNCIAIWQQLTVTATVQVDKWQETAVHHKNTWQSHRQAQVTRSFLFCAWPLLALVNLLPVFHSNESTVTSILITSSPGSKQISVDAFHDGSCIKCHKFPLPLAKGHDVVHREQCT